MLDERFPDDQLFFVAESDFRFYEQDCIKGKDWIETISQAMAAYEKLGPEPNASSHTRPPGPPEGPRPDTGATRPDKKLVSQARPLEKTGGKEKKSRRRLHLPFLQGLKLHRSH